MFLKVITNTMKAEGIKKKKISVRQYFNKITQHLYDLINDHKIVTEVWRH